MKKLIKILPVVMVVCLMVTSVFAIAVPDSGADLANGHAGSSAVNSAAQGIWGTVMTIVQILAVAAVVFAGVRYMFASADQKADIKKSMGILAIGAVLVFGATVVLKFISTAANEVLQ